MCDRLWMTGRCESHPALAAGVVFGRRCGREGMFWRQTRRRRRRHGRARDDARRPAPAPAAAGAGRRAVEPLESRRLLSASVAAAASVATNIANIQGYTPAQIAHAYGFDQIAL